MPLSSFQCLVSSFLGSREDASTTRTKPTLVGEQQIHTFAKQLLPLHTTIFFLFIVLKVSTSLSVIFYNKCPHQVWPRIQPSAGKLVLACRGFKLAPNWAYSLQLPVLWFERLWGRHDCTFDIGGHGRYTIGDYDVLLQTILKIPGFTDNVVTHLLTGLGAGIFVVCAGSPVDVKYTGEKVGTDEKLGPKV
ncbi:hypothetical protein JHK87_034184 [Glycine soja]|nr:hypothetical protein JHK87_034184 [Glycine soja]